MQHYSIAYSNFCNYWNDLGRLRKKFKNDIIFSRGDPISHTILRMKHPKALIFEHCSLFHSRFSLTQIHQSDTISNEKMLRTIPHYIFFIRNEWRSDCKAMQIEIVFFCCCWGVYSILYTERKFQIQESANGNVRLSSARCERDRNIKCAKSPQFAFSLSTIRSAL